MISITYLRKVDLKKTRKEGIFELFFLNNVHVIREVNKLTEFSVNLYFADDKLLTGIV